MRRVKIEGNFDEWRKGTIIPSPGHANPFITIEVYRAACRRMGLDRCDYPVLAEDYPAIEVRDRWGVYAYIQ